MHLCTGQGWRPRVGEDWWSTALSAGCDGDSVRIGREIRSSVLVFLEEGEREEGKEAVGEEEEGREVAVGTTVSGAEEAHEPSSSRAAVVARSARLQGAGRFEGREEEEGEEAVTGAGVEKEEEEEEKEEEVGRGALSSESSWDDTEVLEEERDDLRNEACWTRLGRTGIDTPEVVEEVGVI